MRVIPVLDLKSGLVVRAVAGQRRDYRPIVSRIAGDARPETVARALVEGWGFREAYVADLDAIEGGAPDWNAYAALGDAGLSLILDAGIQRPSDAARCVQWNAARPLLSRLVIGSESLDPDTDLRELARACAEVRPTFSLDLHRGHWHRADWRQPPAAWADELVRCGWNSLIVLDVAAVGVRSGPCTLELCRQIRSRQPEVELLSGGGVRDAADLRAFAAAGCNGVLVASALHDGAITPAELTAVCETDK